MELKDFFAHVMPEEGFRVLGLAKPHPDSPKRTKWRYRKYDTNYKAAGAARIYDDRAEEAVYFGVNSFNDYYLCPEKNYERIRTQVNVHSCRSLFDDFDVKDAADAYATREEALLDLKKIAKALQLVPTIVNSGGGFHMYITADADFDPETWIRLSLMKRAMCKHLGIKIDSSVDKDVARVLRPITTNNRKTGTPREVKLIKLGRHYPLSLIEERLQKYLDDNNLEPATVSTKAPIANPFAGALGDYPPSDPDTVADKCAVIGKFRDTGGESEPEWHKAVGVIKHCDNGEAKIHEWSSKYEGYSYEETQEKIDAWQVGPTTCEEMDKISSCMEGCPFAGKCRTPIQLGATEDAPSVAEEVPQSTTQPTPPVQIIAGQNIPYWQTGFQWNGTVLSKAYTEDVDGNTVVKWRPFCRTFVYPINRIKDVEGRWIVKWRALEKNGDWREFDMPMEELASTDQMAKTMSAHEVFLTTNPKARKDMSEFAVGLIEKLQEWRTETKTYKQFGWTNDYSGFVLGKKMITVDDEVDILLDAEVPADIAVDFGRSGSLDEWIDNIDLLYNRAGAEPYQFALCHSMGSVLVELMGSSNWHGLPLAFTGHGGTGKSTACKIACGFYGFPKLMERQTGDNGSTLPAAIKLTAMMGSIPVLLDEFSGRSPEELTRTGYALANGRDKQRLASNGKFSTVGTEFFKNSFITSNDSIVETISKLPAGYRVEATQLRYFEVAMPQGFRHTVFHDVESGFAERHMDTVYGEACIPYLRFVMKNADWVKRQLQAARAKYNPKSDDENKERFYRDAIVTALVAGKIAKKLGLVTFDIKAMGEWAQGQVLNMRENRKESNIDISEQLAKFIATLPGRLIVTKHFGDGRAVKEHAQEILRGAAVGRVALEDKKVFLTAGCINEWCKENGVKPADMKEELDRAGYIKHKPKSMYIGQGTNVPSGLARCFEINFHKLFSGKALSIVEDDNGIHTEASGTA